MHVNKNFTAHKSNKRTPSFSPALSTSAKKHNLSFAAMEVVSAVAVTTFRVLKKNARERARVYIDVLESIVTCRWTAARASSSVCGRRWRTKWLGAGSASVARVLPKPDSAQTAASVAMAGINLMIADEHRIQQTTAR